jgi:hypothetical protein
MKQISEAEFRELCHAVFDNADATMEESSLLRQLLILTRHKIGHPRPGTGFFATESELSEGLKKEIADLLLTRTEPVFDVARILNEFLVKLRKTRG